MKRIAIICGSRETPTDYSVAAELDKLHAAGEFVYVITGRASGVDNEAAKWAQKRGISEVGIEADWKTHGRAAGPIRNEEMAKLLTHITAEHWPLVPLLRHMAQCVAFPGGKGTANMIATAERYGIEVVRVVPSRLAGGGE